MDNLKDEIPCNQEHLINEAADDDDFDYSLDLTNVQVCDATNKTAEHADTVSRACSDFTRKLEVRHKVACAREGLSFGLSNGQLPSFMRFKVECNPQLWSPESNNEFQSIWMLEVNATKERVIKRAVEFMDETIQTCNMDLKSIRQGALTKIGKDTESSGRARTELTRRMSESKENFDKSLMQYRTAIRTEKRSFKGNVGKNTFKKFKTQ
ncbi:hypothetical protein FSP39_003768 [Pinctada imbricata]|uniref:Uncharacterized protein n=1 Tax=Pinctada imbricata TaxID=66713 RepID=A0AA89CDR1_PINIB|nr:hypothetical protein FSP39_003768 [Pinctada imbricata]